MAKYGPKAKKKIEEVMHEFGKGKLKSGGDGKVVTDHDQAVAIAISEAREPGGKVPTRNKAGKESKTSAKKAKPKK